MKKLLSEFSNKIVKNVEFWLPLLILSYMAYMPSFTTSKVQFEDFHRDFYIGSGKGMLSGRWGLVLWCKVYYGHFIGTINLFFKIIKSIETGYIHC